MSRNFNIIVAYTKNKGIGYNNTLPWKLKADMDFFRRKTTKTKDPSRKNVVIMGKNTYLSVPAKFRPLKDRINIVITSSYTEEGLLTTSSFDSALKLVSSLDNVETIYVIGGSRVYSEALNHSSCNKVYVTEILEPDFTCDVFFPNLPNTYKQYKGKCVDSEGDIKYRMIVYKNTP